MQGIGIVVLTLGGSQLKKCLRGLTPFLDKTVVVNDGKKTDFNKSIKKYISPTYTKYPSACYNMGIRELLKDETIEHVFIVNDTVEIIDDSVFQDYIDVANKTKLKALYLCDNEDDPRGLNENTRLTIDLGDNTLTLHFVRMINRHKKAMINRHKAREQSQQTDKSNNKLIVFLNDNNGCIKQMQYKFAIPGS